MPRLLCLLRVLAFGLLTATLVAPADLPAQQDTSGAFVRTSGSAPQAWTQIHPGGDSECAFGTPYSFFVQEAPSSTKLLIYFQGGGACWNWVSCSGLFDSSVQRNELVDYRGIFDRLNPENPFRDFTVVFVPYCSGDVHVGAATREYGDDAGARPIRHRGSQNAGAVLSWVEEQDLRPEQVVVAGASAGSYGALFHMPTVARMYPSASLLMIGDSGIPLLEDYPRLLDAWGAPAVLGGIREATEPLEAEELTLEAAHRAAASAHPDVLLAQITSDRDAIQSAFYLISGSPGWRAATYALLDDLEAALSSFRSFVVPGTDHGLMRTDAFYAYASNGFRLRDWIRALIDGEPVESRRCGECAP